MVRVSKGAVRRAQNVLDSMRTPAPLDNQVCYECGQPTVIDGVKTGHEFSHSSAKWNRSKKK